MKRVGIMQPYFLPYLGYWQLIKAVDQYVVYDDVNYIKGGWINRNNFLINEEKRLFTILLSEASPNKLINEIIIKDDFCKFLKMVQLNYMKAPFYKEVMPIIESICSYQNKNLALFLFNSLNEILRYLNIGTELLLSSLLSKDNSLTGQEKVIHICRLLHSNEYINAIGGMVLYDKVEFAKYGIELKFLKMEDVIYKQKQSNFIPGLSILDILMYNSKENVNLFLDQYCLL